MEKKLDAKGISEIFEIPMKDIRTYSPLTLAYIGDAVYEIIVRTKLVESGNTAVNRLHSEATRYVNAGAQRKLFEAFEDLLTEEEKAVFKRGRNAKPHSTAKNATLSDYNNATGFEALCGYLFLTGNEERLLYLISEGMKNNEI